jgi:ABC-type polysaccharide/polyol phosphate export permease
MNRFTYGDMIRDLAIGMGHWRIWSALGRNTIKLQYRRAALGPLWLTLQQLVVVMALGYIFASIQGQDFSRFFVYFSIGYTIWQLMAALVTTAGGTFIGIRRFPGMTRAALSNHVYLQFFTQLLYFLHRVLPAIGICLVYRDALDVDWVSLAAGFAALLVFGFWVSALLGCLSLRFHDLMPAVVSMMQVMFFVTPVMYRHTAIAGAEVWFNLNPFFHLLAVVRGSLLGEPATALNWAAVVAVNLVGGAITLAVMRWARPKIAYWV